MDFICSLCPLHPACTKHPSAICLCIQAVHSCFRTVLSKIPSNVSTVLFTADGFHTVAESQYGAVNYVRGVEQEWAAEGAGAGR